ncbi:hypothetical protein GCM10022227_13750 [Streptomyces sedi]
MPLHKHIRRGQRFVAYSEWHLLHTATKEVDDLTGAFTGEGAEETVVRADLAALVGQLRELGLLDARPAPAPDPGPTHVREVLPPRARLSVADRAAGLLALATALFLPRCTPIGAGIAIARVIARVPLRTATPERADALFAAVRRAGRSWPGRAACLEESFACYLAAALRGQGVTWVIGARTAPAGAHAWNEAGGQVIGQDAGERVWPYAPALRVRPGRAKEKTHSPPPATERDRDTRSGGSLAQT